MILINGKSIAIEPGKSIDLMTLAYNHTQILNALIMPTNHSSGFYRASISKSHNLKKSKKELFQFLYFEHGGTIWLHSRIALAYAKKL